MSSIEQAIKDLLENHLIYEESGFDDMFAEPQEQGETFGADIFSHTLPVEKETTLEIPEQSEAERGFLTTIQKEEKAFCSYLLQQDIALKADEVTLVLKTLITDIIAQNRVLFSPQFWGDLWEKLKKHIEEELPESEKAGELLNDITLLIGYSTKLDRLLSDKAIALLSNPNSALRREASVLLYELSIQKSSEEKERFIQALQKQFIIENNISLQKLLYLYLDDLDKLPLDYFQKQLFMEERREKRLKLYRLLKEKEALPEEFSLSLFERVILLWWKIGGVP